MDDRGGVLHRSQIDVFSIFPSANKISFFFCGLFGDDFVGILVVMPVTLCKINFCSELSITLNAAGGNMPGATIAPTGTFFDLKAEEFQRVLDLNLTGTVIPTQVFLRPMVEQGKGCVVNFSSMAAFRPMTRVCGYAAAKAGISNFTAYMATEVASKFGEGIRVNAIAPGFFLTEQNRTLLTNEDGSYTQRGTDVIRQTPFKRFGRPEELCGTIHYLISDAAAFVTGTVAVVDGGFNVFAM